MTNSLAWPGILGMQLGGELYMNFSDDENFNEKCDTLVKMLLDMGLQPLSKASLGVEAPKQEEPTIEKTIVEYDNIDFCQAAGDIISSKVNSEQDAYKIA